MTSPAPTLNHYPKLYQAAKTALEKNCISTSRGSYFRAGPHQFGSLWTRDFCMAVPGILACGSAKLNLAVRDHLSRLLDNLHPDEDLAPRMFDSSSSFIRVLAHSAASKTPMHKWIPPIREPLKPEYFGEHGTRSIDSNILLLRACANYMRATSDTSWLEQYQPALNRCFSYYKTESKSGLLQQRNFEDWQDSAKRSGASSYLNILYYLFCAQDAMVLMIPLNHNFAERLKIRILETFFHPEHRLFRALAGRTEIGLDSNLLALDGNFWNDPLKANDHWSRLLEHPIWRESSFPGRPTHPFYPVTEISWTTKLVGLRHYHDKLIWTWLGALAAKVAIRQNDHKEASRIFTVLEKLTIRDGSIYEIYNPTTMQPFRSWLYQSESFFTWSAGMIIETFTKFY